MSNVHPNGLLRIELKHAKELNAELVEMLEKCLARGYWLPSSSIVLEARAVIAKAKAP